VAKLFVFDLDGTLADTKVDLALAVQKTLNGLGLPEPRMEEVAKHIGHGARHLIENCLWEAMPHRPSAQAVDEALVRFLDQYEADPAAHTRLYPGVLPALQKLRTETCAVLTNKPEKPALSLLLALEIDLFFKAVIGGDSGFGLKPSPQGLLELMRRFGSQPQETILIGDGPQDLGAAKAAGISFIAYTSGFGLPLTDPFHPTMPCFQSFDDLPALLAEFPLAAE